MPFLKHAPVLQELASVQTDQAPTDQKHDILGTFPGGASFIELSNTELLWLKCGQ